MRNESWIILAQQKSELSYQTVVQFICQNLIVWFCSQKSSWSGMLSSRQTERHTFSKLDFNGQKRRRAHSDVTPLILTYFLSMTKSSTKLMGPINPDSALCHLLSDMFYETLLRIQVWKLKKCNCSVLKLIWNSPLSHQFQMQRKRFALELNQVKLSEQPILLVPWIFIIHLKLTFWESKGFPLITGKICLLSTSEPKWAINCLILSIRHGS